MIRLNNNYSKLQAGYLFVEISRRVNAHAENHPESKLIKLGIGDVTNPLPPSIIKAFHQGVDEQAEAESFKGYGPEQGYAFLREAIAEADYASRGCRISADDIFVSDGAKCDTGNFQELFADDVTIAVPDPVYPVYVDTNVMAGRTGEVRDGRYEGLIYLEGTEENDFVPSPADLPEGGADLVYLCFPNNPTGATASREQLGEWVDWAIDRRSLILFDAAYEAFVINPDIPKSIYEIPGAEKCAVEFRSFSKTAGFTGTRCAFTVVPGSIEIDGMKLRDMWNRRHSTKFNGVSYPVQKAAAAVYAPEGKRETRELIEGYLENAKIIREAMNEVGYKTWGGVNSPYVWVKTGEDSWDTFDTLLNEADVVVTPGSGFGRMGKGFIRISAFNSKENVEEAISRILKALK
ncbi:MAG: LL-diaminopimelate aminotransferase [Spirochaetes bacterium]|nr:MAG: LL-diaminopimelate aminotransferase [Spirochaetota bacterium]